MWSYSESLALASLTVFSPLTSGPAAQGLVTQPSSGLPCATCQMGPGHRRKRKGGTLSPRHASRHHTTHPATAPFTNAAPTAVSLLLEPGASGRFRQALDRLSLRRALESGHWRQGQVGGVCPPMKF